MMMNLLTKLQWLLVLPTVCYSRQFRCTYEQAIMHGLNRTEQHFHACKMEDGSTFELRKSIIDSIQSELTSTTTQLSLQNIMIQDDVITEADVAVVVDKFDLVTDAVAKGTKSVVVVRVVSTRDGIEPSIDQSLLSRNYFEDNLFGDMEATFAKQMNLCSAGALTIVPGNNPTGVVDLFVDMSLKDRVMSPTIAGELANAFEFQIANPNMYDHILFCLPQGMQETFIAFAVDNSNLSYFQDPWCQYLSASMHEVGHNYFLSHSDEIFDGAYEDQTCLMGASFAMERGPKMCFNGQKFWALNWYLGKRLSIDPANDGAWNGRLAAFVDHAAVKPNDPEAAVLIQLGDLYLVYNRAKSYNIHVLEKRDQVTIAWANEPAKGMQSRSIMLAGLDGRQTRTFQRNVLFSLNSATTVNVVIEICDILNGGAYDYAELSITLTGQPSACGLMNQAPLIGNIQCGQHRAACDAKVPCCDGLYCRGAICRRVTGLNKRAKLGGNGKGGSAAGGVRGLRGSESGSNATTTTVLPVA